MQLSKYQRKKVLPFESLKGNVCYYYCSAIKSLPIFKCLSTRGTSCNTVSSNGFLFGAKNMHRLLE